VATPFGPVPAARLQPGATLLGPAGHTARLEEVRHFTLPAAAPRRLGLAPPVLIPAGALGFGQPAQDLVLGPAQCLRLGAAWLPAHLLAGTAGITLLENAASLVLLRCAGGAPLLAAGTPLASCGTCPASPAEAVPALLRLAKPPARLHGFVDHADRHGLSGWAIDPAAPDRVLALEAACGAGILAQGLADRPRPDLVQAGAAGRLGRHGFALRFPRPLPPGRPWLLTVRGAGAGPTLAGSPLLVDAARPDPARFDIALAGLPADAPGIGFLAGLLEAALAARAAAPDQSIREPSAQSK
jgi:hypothetical protein